MRRASEVSACGGFVAFGLACSLAAPAWADIDAARIVRMMAAAEHTSAPSVHLPVAEPDGRIPVLVPLPSGVAAGSWNLLEVAPGWGGAHLTPGQVLAFEGAHAGVPIVTGPPRRTMTDFSGQWTGAPQFRMETGMDGTGVVVGVIDTGLDLAHPDFRNDDGSTRVAWYMQRALPAGLQPELEDAYGCTSDEQNPCAILSAADIDGALPFVDSLPDDPDGHGTHVTSIAAGNDPFFSGVAPNATIIIASPSPGGGFSDPDILRAARFIFDRADELGLPAVVNVSLGSDFGPHDGTSALERGLASMVGEDDPGHVMVVAAGNSGALYTVENAGPFGVHTEAHASEHAVTRVPVRAAGAQGTIDGGAYVWVTFEPGDDVSVGIEGPGGSTWVGLTGPGEEQGYQSGDMEAGVINNLVNGKSSLTPDTNGAVLFWRGRWESDEELAVVLKGDGTARLWITGTGGAAPGAGGLGLLFERAIKAGTVAVPASSPDLIAVGCTLNRDSWRPLAAPPLSRLELAAFGPQKPPVLDSTCYFSAAGPNALGQLKPDLVAPGAFVAGAMSRGADPRNSDEETLFDSRTCPVDDPYCYLLDELHGLTSGTSMSSPHVAGAAALLLQRDPGLTQREVRELLQAGARYPEGEVAFDVQLGAGALDLLGTLDLLEARLSPGRVDSAASWYVLASPYLRPDPTAPVQGVVQLRDAEGRVLADVGASEVRVEVAGGLVLQPATHVRGAMYQFAIAAPKGSGGTTATVEVIARGVSLGARTMRVGVDAFAAESGVAAVGGGCSASLPGGTPPGWDSVWLLLAGLWLHRRGLRPSSSYGRS